MNNLTVLLANGKVPCYFVREKIEESLPFFEKLLETKVFNKLSTEDDFEHCGIKTAGKWRYNFFVTEKKFREIFPSSYVHYGIENYFMLVEIQYNTVFMNLDLSV